MTLTRLGFLDGSFDVLIASSIRLLLVACCSLARCLLLVLGFVEVHLRPEIGMEPERCPAPYSPGKIHKVEGGSRGSRSLAAVQVQADMMI